MDDDAISLKDEIIRMVNEEVPLPEVVRILNGEFDCGLTYAQAYHVAKGNLKVRVDITQNRALLPDGRVRRLVAWSMHEQGKSVRDIMAALADLGCQSCEYQTISHDLTYQRAKLRDRERLASIEQKRQQPAYDLVY